MSPHLPSPHGASALHAASPGRAISPAPHGGGKIGEHPRAPSGSKPVGHSSGGTPAGSQPPPSSATAPAPHTPGGIGGPVSISPSPPHAASTAIGSRPRRARMGP